MSARRFISSGYSEVKIKSLLKDKFLFLGANGVVNKCYILFRIENNKINNFLQWVKRRIFVIFPIQMIEL